MVRTGPLAHSGTGMRVRRIQFFGTWYRRRKSLTVTAVEGKLKGGQYL